MDHSELDQLRHSCAHLLAAAVTALWPEVKTAIGPAIKDGFYYDFEFPNTFCEEELPIIEQKMKELVTTWSGFSKHEVSRAEALKEFSTNPYKLELLNDIPPNDTITIVESGAFRDLCRGGHVKNPQQDLKHFKLLCCAGAYWRGNEKNKMLTRIYGTCFPSQAELDEYLTKQSEAKSRDHRKLGKELDLFAFSELVGAGLPLWTPKGTAIRNELQQCVEELSYQKGYRAVKIPDIARLELFKISGHAEKFPDMFEVKGKHGADFILKPANCPHHTQIYSSQLRSYRDLPQRYMETTIQYRDEKPGELCGLARVRAIGIDDGHCFCTREQAKQEALNLCQIIEGFYRAVGLWENHWVSLSLRGSNQNQYIGEPEDWDQAETMLQEISNELKLQGQIRKGEAALYGPKLDYIFADALGREWQLATVQLDFAIPQRFGLSYINEHGQKQTPVMIHRAILGSYERFLSILIEHYQGAFPFWLAPVQAVIININDHVAEYAHKINQTLQQEHIRTEISDKDESLGAKIKAAQSQKVPYMLIVGEQEHKEQTVSLRLRTGEEHRNMSLPQVVAKFQEVRKNKSLTL